MRAAYSMCIDVKDFTRTKAGALALLWTDCRQESAKTKPEVAHWTYRSLWSIGVWLAAYR